jgi:hypothetical protein
MYARASRRAAMLLPKIPWLDDPENPPSDQARRTCPFCGKELKTVAGRAIHITLFGICRSRRIEAFKQKDKRRHKRKKRRRSDSPTSERIAGEPQTKRLRMEDEATAAGPSRSPIPDPSLPRLREAGDGTYIEDYPFSTAGAPIGSARRKDRDLAGHLRSCGRMGDPELFEAAEILMTTGLTGRGRAKHLKGPSVSSLI